MGQDGRGQGPSRYQAAAEGLVTVWLFEASLWLHVFGGCGPLRLGIARPRCFLAWTRLPFALLCCNHPVVRDTLLRACGLGPFQEECSWDLHCGWVQAFTALPLARSAPPQHGNKYFEKPGAQWGECCCCESCCCGREEARRQT